MLWTNYSRIGEWECNHTAFRGWHLGGYIKYKQQNSIKWAIITDMQSVTMHIFIECIAQIWRVHVGGLLVILIILNRMEDQTHESALTELTAILLYAIAQVQWLLLIYILRGCCRSDSLLQYRIIGLILHQYHQLCVSIWEYLHGCLLWRSIAIDPCCWYWYTITINEEL